MNKAMYQYENGICGVCGKAFKDCKAQGRCNIMDGFRAACREDQLVSAADGRINMSVDYTELMEVIEALPVDAFFETDDNGCVVEKDLDASMFVDHSRQFMEAMRLAKHIKIQLEKET